MATEGGGTHAGNGAISRRVLTIRTIRWEAVTRGRGCDRTSRTLLRKFLRLTSSENMCDKRGVV